MVREAWQISVVPLIRAAIPAPDPGPLTAIFTFGCIFMNSSAQTEVSGVTVLEPMILKEPESSSPIGVVVLWLLHPAATMNSTAIRLKASHLFLICLILFSNF